MTIAEAESFYSSDKKEYNLENNRDYANWLESSTSLGYWPCMDIKELQNLINTLGLENVIILKGRIPNEGVPKALNEFSVFCAASIINSESFGVAIVEAMACEIPVIATKIDGFSEVMVDGKTGIMIEKEDYKAISDSLMYMYTHEKERVEFGKNGRKRVLDNYSWNENVKTMISVYEK